jgi:uncharacterized surface protein with fasciclin (FAS1) repeats
MRASGRRCVLPLGLAVTLLCSTVGCGSEAESASAGVGEVSVDSSDSRAHRLGNLVGRTDTLSTLAQALRQAGLMKDLRETGPFTLFAPTDRAFARYLPGFDSLLAPAGSSATSAANATEGTARYADSLRQVLEFHLVRGRITTDDVKDSLRLGTLAEESLVLERPPQNRNRLCLRVDGTPGTLPVRRTLEAQNGVLHVLSRPLRIPPPDTTSRGALGRSDTTNAQTSANGGN